MAIYIKGVDMQTNCTDCCYRPLVGCNPYQDNGMSPSDHRHRTCPLTEVAEPHGRLIDADFEESHYRSMIVAPTPDVTVADKIYHLLLMKEIHTLGGLRDEEYADLIKTLWGISMPQHKKEGNDDDKKQSNPSVR